MCAWRYLGPRARKRFDPHDEERSLRALIRTKELLIKKPQRDGAGEGYRFPSRGKKGQPIVIPSSSENSLATLHFWRLRI